MPALDSERRKETNRQYYARHKERKREEKRKAYAANPEVFRRRSRKFRANNKEIVSRRLREWYLKNKEVFYSLNARRRAAAKQAFPKWANAEAIKNIYAAARDLTQRTGITHHVDHIVPLRGKTVCGLHVETNLQIVTATENLRKHNKLMEI